MNSLIVEVVKGNKEEYALIVDVIKKAVRKSNHKSDRKMGYVIKHSS